MSPRPTTKSTQAAGAVLWRRGSGPSDKGVQIALIHRPRYDDWSLPKGKLDPGETPIVAAVREIEEETGFQSRLGRFLVTVEYLTPGDTGSHKEVHYWAAEATSGTFAPNDEVDELIWVPAHKASQKLTYDADGVVVAEFLALPADTDTTVLVRHAKAGQRQGYPGDDRKRPLDAVGKAQAKALPANVLAFGVREVHSADPVRCVSTVTPLAEALGVDITIEPALSETGWAADPDATEDRMRKIAARDGRAVCSQGKVIPGLLDRLAARDGVTLPADGRSRKGSFWVLSWHNGTLVAADYYDSPLPKS